MFSFLEALVYWIVFQKIDILFLSAYDTHDRVSHAFSRASDRLRSEKVIALNDIYCGSRRVYGGIDRVTYIRETVNWSKQCHKIGIIWCVPPFPHICFLSFHRTCTTVSLDRNNLICWLSKVKYFDER